MLRLLLGDGLSALLFFRGAGVGIAQGNIGNDLLGVALGIGVMVHRRLLHFPGFGQDIGFFPYGLEIFVPGFGHHFGFLPHFRGFSAAAGFVGGFRRERRGGYGVIGGGCGGIHGSRGGCRFFAGRHDVLPGFPFAGVLPAGGHFLVGLFLGGAFLFTADALDAGVAVDGFFQLFDACFEPGFFRGGVGVVLEVGNINFFAVLFGGGCFGGRRGFAAVLFGFYFGVEGVEAGLEPGFIAVFVGFGLFVGFDGFLELFQAGGQPGLGGIGFDGGFRRRFRFRFWLGGFLRFRLRFGNGGWNRCRRGVGFFHFGVEPFEALFEPWLFTALFAVVAALYRSGRIVFFFPAGNAFTLGNLDLGLRFGKGIERGDGLIGGVPIVAVIGGVTGDPGAGGESDGSRLRNFHQLFGGGIAVGFAVSGGEGRFVVGILPAGNALAFG